MKMYLVVIVLMACLPVLTQAQKETVKVWPGGAPGAINNSAYQEKADSQDGVVQYVWQVTDPELTVYIPENVGANGTSVVICPGGGYWFNSVQNEGYMVADWLNSLGITAFVLKYRLPADAIMQEKSAGPLQDVQEAIRIVRRNADKWNINPGRVGVIGFSAGGHLAATASTLYDENVYEPEDTVSARPDFSILVYPVITMDTAFTHMGSRRNLLGKSPSKKQTEHYSAEQQVNENTPPAFLVHAQDDGAVPVMNSIRYYEAMLKYKVPGELHIYEKGGHGFGLGRTGGTESTWPEACEKWLRMSGLLE